MAMKRQSALIITVSLLGGAIIGTALWAVISPILPEILRATYDLGSTSAPWSLDLVFIRITFGLVLRFNLGGAVGALAGLFMALR